MLVTLYQITTVCSGLGFFWFPEQKQADAGDLLLIVSRANKVSDGRVGPNTPTSSACVLLYKIK